MPCTTGRENLLKRPNLAYRNHYRDRKVERDARDYVGKVEKERSPNKEGEIRNDMGNNDALTDTADYQGAGNNIINPDRIEQEQVESDQEKRGRLTDTFKMTGNSRSHLDNSVVRSCNNMGRSRIY